MEMSKEEIVRNYTQAKNKSAQIGILADLNGCSKQTIRNTLHAAGVELERSNEKRKKVFGRDVLTGGGGEKRCA